MPVSQLLCEGASNSPDVRVLLKLLSGRCGEIKPMSGKYGMGVRIIARRENLGENNVYGILDGDFKSEWRLPENIVAEWENDGIHFGWRWERKEIENYLIDPVVVERALGDMAPNMETYKTELESARDRIAIYQAARTALSANRSRFYPLPSSFGSERGRENHPFPDAFDEDSCRNSMFQTLAAYQQIQCISREQLAVSFDAYLMECRQSGCRYQHYLHAFAGKDLFWAMDSWLRANNFIGANAFREKILCGISKTAEDIAPWLQEWENLRDTISRIL